MKIHSVLVVALLLCCQRFCVWGAMSGNVPTIKNRKFKCDKLVKIIEDSWLANCAHMCLYESDCLSFSFGQLTRRCELYRVDSASAGDGDMVEENGVVSIDVDNWLSKDAACLKKPCTREQGLCLPDQQSTHCTGPHGQRCPDGWVPWEGKCYYFNITKEQYKNAEASCKVKGAKLAEPRTPSVNEFLKCRISHITPSDWWLGMNDREIENEWVWNSDGSSPSFFDWAPREPNGKTVTNCGSLSNLNMFMWNDALCESWIRPICEMI